MCRGQASSPLTLNPLKTNTRQITAKCAELVCSDQHQWLCRTVVISKKVVTKYEDYAKKTDAVWISEKADVGFNH
jgi:hypothetical protein